MIKFPLYVISLASLLSFAGLSFASETSVVPFDAPQGIRNSDSPIQLFADGRSVPTWTTAKHHVARFAFDGKKPVKIRLVSPSNYDRMEIRPLAFGISPQKQSDGSWQFEIPADFNRSKVLAVGYTGENRELTGIFAMPPVPEIPAGARVFGPGLHKAEDGIFRPKAGETWYLDPAATLEGVIYAEKVDDVTLLGYGVVNGVNVLQPSERGQEHKRRCHTIGFHDCNRVTVNGIMAIGDGWHITLFFGDEQLDGLVVRDHVTLRGGQQSDPITLGSYTNAVIDRSFLAGGDNVIVLGWGNEIDNLVISNTVMYPINVGDGNLFPQGAHSKFFTEPGRIKNVLLKDCYSVDVLPALVDVRWGKLAEIENITFDGYWQDPALGEARGGKDGERKIIYVDHRRLMGKIPVNFTFRNAHFPANFVGGRISKKTTVTFENCTLAGEPLLNAAQLGWKEGDGVRINPLP